MLSPDWDDVGTVYNRMQGLGLLTTRARPNGPAGHIFSAAVFARAARYATRDFDLEEFTKEYCEWKQFDYEEFLSMIREFWDGLGNWDTDPYTILEVLSAL